MCIRDRYYSLSVRDISLQCHTSSDTTVIGALTYNHSRAQWRKVFYITAAVEWFGTIVYLLFGSGERQDWDDVVKST